MKTAFIFPGQGSQAIGMGVPLADQFSEAKALYVEASDILGWDILSVCREGPDDKLRQTDIAQPALYVTGVAAATVLRAQGIEAAAVAGHSIGEYSALAAAGVFSFSDGLRLVKERGRLMQEAAQASPGGMAAILGMTRESLQALCAEIQTAHGTCVPVNFNSPEQIVVAGTRSAIEALVAQAPARGAKRVIALNVAGAFHSPIMKDAATRMAGVLSGVTFQPPLAPVVMNADGQPHSNPSDIQKTLARQLDSAVEWVQSIEALKALGCTIFVECGAGRVLSGLLRRIDKQLQSHSTETVEAVAETREALSKTASPGTN